METFEIAEFDVLAVAWIGLVIVVLAIIAGIVISILARHPAPIGLGFITAWVAFLLGVFLPLTTAGRAHDESEFKAGLESLDYSNVTVDSEGDFTAATRLGSTFPASSSTSRKTPMGLQFTRLRSRLT